ncbi:hypothetical protein TorRG33x02_098100 [Trema orientale]|uniref:Uncharacterized protein n=1 Tax=Trema orientale TaxID=63057 RepID=A0A2P5F988_TREOI|nr:hypothetical protein TorRG33x02_098100 [Trema orientale]
MEGINPIPLLDRTNYAEVLLTRQNDSISRCGDFHGMIDGARPPMHKLVGSWSHSPEEPKTGRNQLTCS